MNRLVFGAIATVLLATASCGGGGATLAGPDDGAAVDTGIIEGYITEADIERSTSAAGDGLGGIEVWCEDPGNGQRLGQDTTGNDGHYRIGGLPADTPMLLKFQYQLSSQSGDDNGRVIEGAQQVRLKAREQLRLDAGICPYDDDGDGNPDDVGCTNEQLQVQVRDRQQVKSGEAGGGQGGSATGGSGEGGGNSYGDGECDGDGNAYGNGDGDGECDGDGNAYGNGDGDGECDGDGNAYGNGDGDGECDGDPDQTRDQQQEQLRDGEGDDCDPEQSRDRDRDGTQPE
jgi:hypothetical protein